MKKELPIELPELLRLKIRAGLLQIEHSGQKDTKTRLDAAYNVFARTLSQGGETLSSLLLKEKIPGWVLKWAIERKWVEYPPQRPRRQMPEFVVGKYTSAFESIPVEELTIKFGEYLVTEAYKSRIMNSLEAAIAHWEAKAAWAESSGHAGFASTRTSVPEDLTAQNFTNLLPETSREDEPLNGGVVSIVQPGDKQKRGRPQVITDEKKAKACNLKESGGTNKEAAAVLYDTKHPSDQQKKNVSTILRHYRQKLKQSDSAAKRTEASPRPNKTKG